MRPPRVVTVCVLGRKPSRVDRNARASSLLDQVVDAVISRVDWHPVDAIVFPGGFFRSPVYVGNRSPSERAAVLEATDFGHDVMAAAYRLDAAHPGALIVVGICRRRVNTRQIGRSKIPQVTQQSDLQSIGS
jgi:hypothetical protein